MGLRQERLHLAALWRRPSRSAATARHVLAMVLIAWLSLANAEPPSAQVLKASVEAPRESFDGRRLVSGGYLAGIQQHTTGAVGRRPPMVRLGPDVDNQRLCLRGISQDGRYEVTTTLRVQPGPRPALVSLPRLPINDEGAQRYLAPLPWNDLGLLVSPGGCDVDSTSARLLPLIWPGDGSTRLDSALQVAVNAMGGERVAARLLDDERPGKGLTLDCRPDSERRALGFNFRCLADQPLFSGPARLVLLVFKHGHTDARIEVDIALP